MLQHIFFSTLVLYINVMYMLKIRARTPKIYNGAKWHKNYKTQVKISKKEAYYILSLELIKNQTFKKKIFVWFDHVFERGEEREGARTAPAGEAEKQWREETLSPTQKCDGGGERGGGGIGEGNLDSVSANNLNGAVCPCHEVCLNTKSPSPSPVPYDCAPPNWVPAPF